VRAVVIALVLLLAGSAHGQSMQEAQEAFTAQRYDDAAAAYSALGQERGSPAAYYNAGNAYFRAGKLGPAALGYERALRLDPDLEDARYNLEVTRETIAAKLGKDSLTGSCPTPWWARAVEAWPVWAFLTMTLLADVLVVVLLLARRGRPPGARRALLGAGAILAGLVFIAFGLLLAGRLVRESSSPDALVTADQIVMRELPDPRSREMPTIHAGLRVQVVRERPEWTRIRLANQVEGWVPAGAVGRVVE
jgi:tetratricopeptide (TPR) repeat protein